MMTDRELNALRKAEQCVERDPQFSPDEIKTLREAIKTYEGIRAFGRGARLLIVLLGTLAAGIAAWDVVVAKVRAWAGI